MKKIKDRYTNNIFENIKHIDEYGNEYWYARELQKVLEYKDWRNFQKVIDKAVLAANNSISSEEDWVVEINKPIRTGKGKEEIIKDYKLSRYICYLIVQNADPSKEVVALGQTYFAIQTRKQEITEQEYDSLSDDEKRFYQRKLTKQGNYTLQKVASSVGVKNMAEFHNPGYKGLYNGETADDLFKKMFEIILTDNGWEFSKPNDIEFDYNTGEKLINVFYCNPYSSWKKGGIERNHEFIRYIIPKGITFD